MKIKIIVIVVLAAVLFLPYSQDARAGPWSQLPSLDPANGYAFSSETQVPSHVADDFLCEDGLPIIGVRWWGSYWDTMYDGESYYPSEWSNDWGDPANNPPVSAFNINIYADIPQHEGVPLWGHPDAQVYTGRIEIANVTETPYGTISRGSVTETVFQYDALLPVLFEHGVDQIYWLSIQAVDDGENPIERIQWGWHESSDHSPINAVQLGFSPQGWWDKLLGEDMAFELKAIPIPASVLLLGSGLVGLIALRRRMR